MISALVSGELMAEPVQRTSASGTPFWTCTVRVAAGSEAIFVGISTFSETAGTRIMALHKGATLAAVGPLEATTWQTKSGESRQGWRLTANEVLTAYQASKRRKAGAPADPLKDSRSAARLWAADEGLPESEL
jgi:single-stranded DNA-binding protein